MADEKIQIGSKNREMRRELAVLLGEFPCGNENTIIEETSWAHYCDLCGQREPDTVRIIRKVPNGIITNHVSNRCYCNIVTDAAISDYIPSSPEI